MLNMFVLAFDLTLITFLLISVSLHYWSGSLLFIVDIVFILALSASRIARWQLRRLIRKSEQEFEAMYLNELERRGQELPASRVRRGSRLK